MADPAAVRKRIGRPPLGVGQRTQKITSNVSPEIRTAIYAAAEDRGITVSRLIHELLAREFSPPQKAA